MKLLLKAIILGALLSACESVGDQLMNSGKIKDLSWIKGNWKRVNDGANQQTYENWQFVDDSLLLGHGFTLAETDTVWQEFIELRYENHRWNFKVTGENDSIPTIFELSSIDSNEFTCFNLKNDFPHHISYRRNKDSLNALIWGDSLKIPFNFIKES